MTKSTKKLLQIREEMQEFLYFISYCDGIIFRRHRHRRYSRHRRHSTTSC